MGSNATVKAVVAHALFLRNEKARSRVFTCVVGDVDDVGEGGDVGLWLVDLSLSLLLDMLEAERLRVSSSVASRLTLA